VGGQPLCVCTIAGRATATAGVATLPARVLPWLPHGCGVRLLVRLRTCAWLLWVSQNDRRSVLDAMRITTRSAAETELCLSDWWDSREAAVVPLAWRARSMLVMGLTMGVEPSAQAATRALRVLVAPGSNLGGRGTTSLRECSRFCKGRRQQGGGCHQLSPAGRWSTGQHDQITHRSCHGVRLQGCGSLWAEPPRA